MNQSTDGSTPREAEGTVHQPVFRVDSTNRHLAVADQLDDIVTSIQMLLDEIRLGFEVRRKVIAKVIEKYLH